MNSLKQTRRLLVSSGALLMTMVSVRFAHSQGTFVYDQQSATNTGLGGSDFVFQSFQPMGQSFTPAFDSIGFVQLKLVDFSLDGVGASVFVNLRENSITGNVLAASSPTFMKDGFQGITNFFFSPSSPLIPGTTYYLQPVLQSGDPGLELIGDHYNYPGGTAFFLGAASPSDTDLWFREGYFVPEPSSAILLLIGGGFLFLHRRRKSQSAP